MNQTAPQILSTAAATGGYNNPTLIKQYQAAGGTLVNGSIYSIKQRHIVNQTPSAELHRALTKTLGK